MARKGTKALGENKISNLYILISIFVLLIVQIPVAWNNMTNFNNTYLDPEGYLKHNLEQLRVGSNLSAFTKLLGEPLVTKTITLGTLNYREDYFVNKLFYVDTISSLSNSVLFFAVTTREGHFRPTFQFPGSKKSITLGVSSFNETNLDIIQLDSDEVTKANGYKYNMGANFFYYFEKHYLANPGNYQTVYLGLNDAGSFKYNASLVDEPPSGLSKEQLEAIRKNWINTFGVTVPYGYDKNFDDNFQSFLEGRGVGAFRNDVRIFD
jgi:hypothetical protein